MVCSNAYAEPLHNHIQRVIHGMKYELHKSGNDHSPLLISNTFQRRWLAASARTKATRFPLLICQRDKQAK